MQKLKEWLQSPEVQKLRGMSMTEIIEIGFHREKIVPIHVNTSLLYSPANGILLYAKKVKSQDEIVNVHGTPFRIRELVREDLKDSEFYVFGIFMTYYDIHVNYIPSSGYLEYRRLPDLKVESLSMTKIELELLEGREPDPDTFDYLFYNERMLNKVYDICHDQVYYVIQIADAEVGAIVPFQDSGCFIPQGYSFGAIRFGSQVDVIIPVKPGKKYKNLVEDKIGWHIEAVIDPLISIEVDK